MDGNPGAPTCTGVTEIGTRCHGGDVCGVQQVGAGTGGASASRSHPAQHRDVSGKHSTDHVAHRGIQAARRIDTHDHDGSAALLRECQATDKVIG
ncbi:MAG: hypothetical protein ACPG1A_13915 [Halioglobus sp.]